LVVTASTIIFPASHCYDSPQGTRCKQKRNAANKKEMLQTKNTHGKEKRNTANAANKESTLQIKKREHIMRAHSAKETG